MKCYTQPRRLEDLSKLEFIRSVSDDCCYVTMNKLWNETGGARLCQHLHEVFRSIPVTLLNDVTAQILDRLTDYLENIDKTSDDYTQEEEEEFPNIVSSFYEAILAERVTVLNLRSDQIRHLKYISQSCLTRLKMLKVTPFTVCFSDRSFVPLVVPSLPSMSRLKVLHVEGNASDELVSAAAQHCHDITSLHVSFSFDVTDRCIDDIVKLKNLQELGLFGTSVTKAGYIQLVNKMEQPEMMKCFKFTYHSRKQLLKICNKFVNLEEMMIGEEGDLTCLKSLRHLKSLHLSSANCSNLNEVFLNIGHQLQCLKIFDCDTCLILNYFLPSCTQLQTLEIECSEMDVTTGRDQHSFPSIKELKVKTKNFVVAKYLLSRCHNLEMLTVSKEICYAVFCNDERLQFTDKNKPTRGEIVTVITSWFRNLKIFKMSNGRVFW